MQEQEFLALCHKLVARFLEYFVPDITFSPICIVTHIYIKRTIRQALCSPHFTNDRRPRDIIRTDAKAQQERHCHQA